MLVPRKLGNTALPVQRKLETGTGQKKKAKKKEKTGDAGG